MEERLSRQEPENRRLKRAGALILAVMLAMVLMGYVAGEKVVEAERFELIDSIGQLRAGHVGGTATETGLHVYDHNGKLAWKTP